MKWTEPSANTQLAPPTWKLQKWLASHWLDALPGPYTAGLGHSGLTSSRRSTTASAESYADQAHQPQSSSGAGDGGRSPISRVWLAPSTTSVSRVLELA